MTKAGRPKVKILTKSDGIRNRPIRRQESQLGKTGLRTGLLAASRVTKVTKVYYSWVQKVTKVYYSWSRGSRAWVLSVPH